MVLPLQWLWFRPNICVATLKWSAGLKDIVSCVFSFTLIALGTRYLKLIEQMRFELFVSCIYFKIVIMGTLCEMHV